MLLWHLLALPGRQSSPPYFRFLIFPKRGFESSPDLVGESNGITPVHVIKPSEAAMFGMNLIVVSVSWSNWKQFKLAERIWSVVIHDSAPQRKATRNQDPLDSRVKHTRGGAK